MLVTRNVRIGRHRTSLRFEKKLWEALEEICAREKMTMSDLCTHIDTTKGKISRSAAVRHHVLCYFRDAATDEGHYCAGHGWISVSGRPLDRSHPEIRTQSSDPKGDSSFQQLRAAPKLLMP